MRYTLMVTGVFTLLNVGSLKAQWSGNDNQTASPNSGQVIEKSQPSGLSRSYLGTSLYGSTVKNALEAAALYYLKDCNLQASKGYAIEFGLVKFAQGTVNPGFFNFNMTLALGTISSKYTYVNYSGNYTPDKLDEGVGLNYKLDFIGGQSLTMSESLSLQYGGGVSLGYVLITSDEMDDFVLMATPMLIGRMNLSSMYFNLAYNLPFTSSDFKVNNFATIGAGINF